ncbi:MAG: MFS transporter [Polyangiaceae bacterium]|nr:MFS transporter [Polyangiaceae bacterium]NUQ79193.1 MFS transporter [Polyangiaceae bacterium]
MLRSPLTPIFLTVLVDVLAMTLVLPLLPFYAQHFGASPLVVTVLTASFAACQLISGPILGRISDSAGRRPTLLVSQMGTFIGFLILGGANSLWMLFAGRIIDGLTAGNLSIAQAYISDVTEPENRTKAFALIGIAFGAGFLLGPAASGFLAHRFGYAAPAFGAAALSFTSIVVTWSLLREPSRKASEPTPGEGAEGSSPKMEQPRGRFALVAWFFGRPAPRLWLLQFLSFSLSFAMLLGGLALFLERRLEFNVEQTGYVFAFSGVVGGMLQGGMGKIARRFGEERLVLWGLLFMAAGNALLGFTFNLPTLLVSIFLGAIGGAVVRPSVTTMITKSVGRTEQGAVLGVSQSLTSSSQIVGPLIAGWLIQHGKLSAFGLVAGSFALIGAVRLLVLRTGAAAKTA